VLQTCAHPLAKAGREGSGTPKIEERPGKIGSHARAISHPSVTCALTPAGSARYQWIARRKLLCLRWPQESVDGGQWLVDGKEFDYQFITTALPCALANLRVEGNIGS